jgi:hypothetical protein
MVVGCSFQVNQKGCKKIQELRLIITYNVAESTNKYLRRSMAVPLLAEEHILQMFSLLIVNSRRKVKDLTAYMIIYGSNLWLDFFLKSYINNNKLYTVYPCYNTPHILPFTTK